MISLYSLLAAQSPPLLAPTCGSPPQPPKQLPCLPHADRGLHTRPQVKAAIVHEGRLVLPVHHYPGPGHCGQQRDEVILLCAQRQGQTWGCRGSRAGEVLEKYWGTETPLPPAWFLMLHREQGQEAPGLDSGVDRENWDKIPVTPGEDLVAPTGDKEQRGLLPGWRRACCGEAQRHTGPLGHEHRVGKCGWAGPREVLTHRDGRSENLLTIFDPRHGRHPEVRVVLAIESVAVPIYRVVKVGVIPIQDREKAGSERKVGAGEPERAGLSVTFVS